MVVSQTPDALLNNRYGPDQPQGNTPRVAHVSRSHRPSLGLLQLCYRMYVVVCRALPVMLHLLGTSGLVELSAQRERRRWKSIYRKQTCYEVGCHIRWGPSLIPSTKCAAMPPPHQVVGLCWANSTQAS
jgi:hypothetical protein